MTNNKHSESETKKADETKVKDKDILRGWNEKNQIGTLVEVVISRDNLKIKEKDETIGLARMVSGIAYIDLKHSGGAYLKDINLLPSNHPDAIKKEQQDTKKCVLNFIYNAGFFCFFIIASWCATITFKNNDTAPVFAAILLFISFIIRIISPTSRKSLVRVMKVLSDFLAVCLTFLSLVSLPYFTCDAKILYALMLSLCFVASVALYREL